MNFLRAKVGYIIIGLLAVFLGSMVATGLLSGKNERRNEPAPGGQATAIEEPPFTKEGQLWFLSEKGDTITGIDIEVAETDYETTRGLMFRKTMEPQQGMLFIFPGEELRGFWMKNTYLPLDIIYADSSGVIGNSQNYTEPFSEATLPSEKKAKYVVEVNAGFWDKHKLRAGYKIAFNRTDRPA
jgi:uncharacterized membrane protein (UPF0127 family)